MEQTILSVENILAEAVEIAPADRQAFVEKACGGNAELRATVERLLANHDQAGSFLEHPAAVLDPVTMPANPVAIGTRIGPYKLLEIIGEGGMGVVYLAEQQEPVRRQVALKVIKPGMDSKQIVARFEAERQALALMDHPNIARVLEAGAIDTGHPYFVMELVRGIAITDYCDQARLTVRQRLDVFMQVCRAVQHAHTKGVIHRDLKPSNVLVTSDDGVPVPKVIDFGVAKALEQPLTERTLHTGFAQMVGTPLYMSPEQAEFSLRGVDTRSDIYSLGVLLYELLTGATPFDKERLRAVDFDELRRIIREEEPAKPSTRISTLGEAGSTVSARRQSDPRRLTQFLRGEIDWIVMKCLEKDRQRRYETATALAADIGRYLRNEAVEACPPSATYRLRKFTQRNRGPVLTAVAIMLALLAGIIGTSIGLVQAHDAEADARGQAIRAEQARAKEEKQRKQAEQATEAERKAKQIADERRRHAEEAIALLESVFRNLDPKTERKDPAGLRKRLIAKLDDVATQLGADAADPLTQARLQHALGMAFLGLGEPDKAVVQLKPSLDQRQAKLGDDHLDTLTNMNSLAIAYLFAGKLDLALDLHEQTFKKTTAVLGPDHPLRLDSMHGLAVAYKNAKRLDLALPLFEEVIEKRRAIPEPMRSSMVSIINDLAVAYKATDAVNLNVPLAEQRLRKMKALLGPDHPSTLKSMEQLASAYATGQKHDLSVPLYEHLVEYRKATLGAADPITTKNMTALAFAYAFTGKLDLAVPLCEELILIDTCLRPDGPLDDGKLLFFGSVYQRAGKFELAMRVYEELLEYNEATTYGNRIHIVSRLREVYARVGRFNKSETMVRELLAHFNKQEPGSARILQIRKELAFTLLRQKRYTDAELELRESLAINGIGNSAIIFPTKSFLGEALLGQKKYADAEPLLIAGYKGFKSGAYLSRSWSDPDPIAILEQLVQLYEATGQMDKAAEWRQKLDAEREALKKARR